MGSAAVIRLGANLQLLQQDELLQYLGVTGTAGLWFIFFPERAPYGALSG